MDGMGWSPGPQPGCFAATVQTWSRRLASTRGRKSISFLFVCFVSIGTLLLPFFRFFIFRLIFIFYILQCSRPIARAPCRQRSITCVSVCVCVCRKFGDAAACTSAAPPGLGVLSMQHGYLQAGRNVLYVACRFVAVLLCTIERAIADSRVGINRRTFVFGICKSCLLLHSAGWNEAQGRLLL